MIADSPESPRAAWAATGRLGVPMIETMPTLLRRPVRLKENHDGLSGENLQPDLSEKKSVKKI
jgi:hypothetical protein